jgi:hypothetical protein
MTGLDGVKLAQGNGGLQDGGRDLKEIIEQRSPGNNWGGPTGGGVIPGAAPQKKMPVEAQKKIDAAAAAARKVIESHKNPRPIQGENRPNGPSGNGGSIQRLPAHVNEPKTPASGSNVDKTRAPQPHVEFGK